METVKKQVKSGGKTVAEIDVEVFDNLEEIEGFFEEDKIVDMINRTHAVNAMDAARREATGGGSTGIRELMKKLKDHPDIMAELRTKMGVE